MSIYQLTIYIDLDDTLLDYKGAHAEALRKNPNQPYPQSQMGFYSSLEPLEGAIDAWNTLTRQGHNVYFLTAPSLMNPMSYTEKRLSVEKHFGFDACRNLIICSDKSLLRGNILIDDRMDSHNQINFEGTVYHFGSENSKDWATILKKIDRFGEVPVTEHFGYKLVPERIKTSCVGCEFDVDGVSECNIPVEVDKAISEHDCTGMIWVKAET